MSHDYAGLELEDLTPRQLRKLLKGSLISSMTRNRRKGARDEDENDSDDDEAAKENDDLVDLHREKKGDSKSPKVTQADLPKGVTMPEDEDDKPEERGKKIHGKA